MMKCQQCSETATVHFTEAGGRKVAQTLHFCTAHAKTHAEQSGLSDVERRVGQPIDPACRTTLEVTPEQADTGGPFEVEFPDGTSFKLNGPRWLGHRSAPAVCVRRLSRGDRVYEIRFVLVPHRDDPPDTAGSTANV